MKISIVTPVLNGERFIGETLVSVASQEGDVEHVVMDALSSDSTSDIVTRLGCAGLRHVREADKGLYYGMNAGIARATGDVIGIINADDLLTPHALRRVREAFSDDSIDYVYSDLLLIDEQSRVVGQRLYSDRSMSGECRRSGRDWRFLTPVAHPTLFVRKRVYDDVGVFDTRYRLAADHEFMARLVTRGLRGRYLGAPLASFRLGGASAQGGRIFGENESIAVHYGMAPLLARMNKYRSMLGRTKAELFARVSPKHAAQ